MKYYAILEHWRNNEMKEWQKGIEREELLKLEEIWNPYNERCESPFIEMKKHKIAAAIDAGWYEYTKDFALQSRVLRAKSKVQMYTAYKTVPIATMQKGDRCIDRIAYTNPRSMVERLKAYDDENVFLFINEEIESDKSVAKEAGFKKIGIKVNTFSDISGLYFKDKLNGTTPPREFPELKALHEAEYGLLMKCKGVPNQSDLCNTIMERLDKMDLPFTNHYSNYNKGNNWSAIALRGYLPDFTFITKPEEIKNKDLLKLHNKNQDFRMQDTHLRAEFPEVETLLSYIPGIPHRIRFLKLAAHSEAGEKSAKGQGELQRHTDQVDPHSGIQDTNLMRFHYPLATNQGVTFTDWDCDGAIHEVHMGHGDLWYIDARKPHKAVNRGDTVRTHMVVDVEANDDVRALIC